MWKDVRAKYRVIERFKTKYPVQKMCEIFEVSKSGFYKWRNRISSSQQLCELDQWIIECQTQAKQTYGYRRVWQWIKRTKNRYYNPITVLRHMRQLDLLAQIRRRRPFTLYKQGAHRYENLLNRQFEQNQTNYRWVTDVTYIITPQKTYYLSAIMDLCGRYIVAYRLGTEATASLVCDTVRDALHKERVADGLALHSDQGCQYTSQEYYALTQEYHFDASMSRRGCPYDNALMENFFGTFKTECLYRCKPTTAEQVRALVDEYIHFYNYERIDMKYGLTPNEIRRKAA